jgi:hypothetical protein
VLEELDYALAELRAHALGDLLHASTMNNDGQQRDLLDAEAEEMGGTPPPLCRGMCRPASSGSNCSTGTGCAAMCAVSSTSSA